jgi:hypothetical protein
MKLPVALESIIASTSFLFIVTMHRIWLADDWFAYISLYGFIGLPLSYTSMYGVTWYSLYFP